ncbi:MAG: carbohydrate binding domain-containing protein [Candidatus Sumerlaeia bacterium]|nr:carbohydrate binding domain-containing protein [Candidatus Sumerlaeia bacterium]
MRFPCAIVLIVGLSQFVSAPVASEAPNLVFNGDFSQSRDGKPVGWATAGSGEVVQRIEIVTENGNPFLRHVCTKAERTSGASHAMVAQVGRVVLERGKQYEFSCRARASGLRGRTVSVSLPDTAEWQDSGLSLDLQLGASWRTFRRVFTAARSVNKTGRLQFYYWEPGVFDLDDVKIIEIAPQTIEFTDVVPAAGGKNLVPNGSFEIGGIGWSSLGRGAGWGNLSRLHGRIESSGGTHGVSFLRIPLGGDYTPVLYFDYLRPVVRREIQVLAASLGWIAVTPNQTYTVSCDMRSSVEGASVLLGVIAQDPATGRRANQQRRIQLGTAWQRHSYTFRPAHRYVFVTVGPDLENEMRVDVDIDAVQLEIGGQATTFEPRAQVEIGVEPSEPGGICTAGEKGGLLVRAFNNGASTVRANVELHARDFFDTTTPLPFTPLEIGAGRSATQHIRLHDSLKGYFHVRAQSDGQPVLPFAGLRLAVVPKRAADDSVLGLNHAFASSYLIQQGKKIGITWYRDWSLKWQDLEPSPGQWRWEVGDTQIDRVLREGVHLMALLPFGSAQWNSEAPDGIPTTGYPGVRLKEAWAPKDWKTLGDFTAAVVGRYKDRLNVWEFLNEPLYTDYALPGERHSKKYPGKHYTPADYVKLLKIAADGMRRSDPKCRVMGGIAGPPGLLTREVIEAGILDVVDLFNLHMYPGSRLPESYLPEMDTLLSQMDKHGGRKPVWITEMSYYGADDLPRSPFTPSRNNWAEERLLSGERECAELTVRYFVVMLSRGVEKIFIHSGASGSVNQPNFECCLFAYGGAPRKSAAAMAVLTDLLGPNPKPAAEKMIGDTVHCFAFETGQRAVLVLWTTDEDKQSKVSVAAQNVECLDLMGNPIAVRPLTLSPTPVYLVGPAGRGKDILSSLAFGP